MTKKLLTIAIAAIAFIFSANAQTIVSTTPTNRNALLEEFTGRNCGYCPDGHLIANQIAAQHPGRFWSINIHAGGFSPTTYPNLNTSDGNIIHNYFNISGYPCGTVNRNSRVPSDRGSWSGQVNNVLSQSSCVNIGAIAIINPETRMLHVDVELYYTANSTASTNKLSVALLQNNILGSQSGGSSNPSQWINGQYNHMHIFRDMITGTWGDVVDATTEGSFHQFSYDYEIPESIGNPNGVDVVLEDLQILVWVAQDNLQVITANEAMLFISDGSSELNPHIASTSQSSEIECSNALNINTSIINIGTVDITSLTVYYDFNNVSIEQNVDCYIAPNALFSIPFTIPVSEGVEDVNITITKANGSNLEFNEGLYKIMNVNAYQGYAGSGDEIVVKIWHDKYGQQVTWKLFNSVGDVVEQGGPYSQLPGTSTRLQQKNITIESSDCYRFEIYDSNGDGINNGNGEGHYQIEDAEGNIIFERDGVFASSESTDFHASPSAQTYVTINPTVTPADAGTVVGAGDYIEGTKVALFANPNAGKSFVNWVITTPEGEVTHAEQLLILEDVTAATTSNIVANFSEYQGVESFGSDIELYPNPAKDVLSISNIDNVGQVMIYNMQGQIVMNGEVSNNINISHLPKGMYIVKLISEQGSAVKKFIKE